MNLSTFLVPTLKQQSMGICASVTERQRNVGSGWTGSVGHRSDAAPGALNLLADLARESNGAIAVVVSHLTGTEPPTAL